VRAAPTAPTAPTAPCCTSARRRHVISAHPSRPRRHGRTALLVAAATAGLDQASKVLALQTLDRQVRLPVLGDWFGLQLAFNPGTVMSLGSGNTGVLTVVAVIAVVALGIGAARARSVGWAWAIGLVWGGATGNLLNRLFAPPAFGRGHVTDFLAYGHLFVGNLADVALGLGAVLAAWLLMRSALEDAPHDGASRDS